MKADDEKIRQPIDIVSWKIYGLVLRFQAIAASINSY